MDRKTLSAVVYWGHCVPTTLFLQDMFLMAAMGPPGGGRTHISRRLQSRFSLINMTFPQVSLYCDAPGVAITVLSLAMKEMFLLFPCLLLVCCW